jgi:hypothetical protein
MEMWNYVLAVAVIFLGIGLDYFLGRVEDKIEDDKNNRYNY